MNLGELIREARERLGWTQSQLAERVGVTPGFITKIEGNEALPGYDRMLTIANLLVLDSAQLFSLMERSKQERTRKRLRTRGSVHGAFHTRGTPVPDAYDGTGEDALRGAQASVISNHPSTAEQIGLQVLASPDFQRAFTYVREAIADPILKDAVLITLECFARQAKPQRPAAE